MAVVDTQYVQRREEIDVEGGDKEMYAFRLARLEHAYAAFRELTQREKFDVAMVPNGGVLEFASRGTRRMTRASRP